MKDDTFKILTLLMDDEIREMVHFELAPCAPEEFLEKYCEYDQQFREIADDYIRCERD